MSKLQIVIDSNIYISSIVYGGTPRRFLEAVESSSFRIAISIAIRDEVVEVLIEKFGYDPAEIANILLPLWERAIWVQPGKHAAIARDADDNAILDCAAAADAAWIVTGDKDLLSLGSYSEILILSVRQALNRLEAETTIDTH